MSAVDLGSDAPADLAAVQADELLLTAVGRRDPARGPLPGDWLAQVLVAWRCDIVAEPIPQLVDTDTALRIVASTARHRLALLRRWFR